MATTGDGNPRAEDAPALQREDGNPSDPKKELKDDEEVPPPPPPPPPPPVALLDDGDSSPKLPPSTLRSMSILVSYPSLIPHEEALGRSAYEVRGWCGYLEEIDELLEAMAEAHSASTVGGAGKGSSSSEGRKKKKKRGGPPTQIDIGGRVVKTAELKDEMRDLRKARIQVGERALSLLPGSYKLWRSHLAFRVARLEDGNRTAAASSAASYPVRSTARHARYRATLSAFERSLVRMNKYPRIWLDYASFLIRHDPTCSVTNVRRLFDRSLLALPATQHDRIWVDYLAYVTQSLPEGLSEGRGAAGTLLARYGGVLGPVCSMIKDGTIGPSSESSAESPTHLYPIEIPPETALRVYRRYARDFDPTAREALAELCVTNERWGEASALLLEILNDPDFLSPRGSTRHELWMKLAEICTDHPDEIRRAGVDFDAIVRAALNPATDGNGWRVFDHLPTDEGTMGGVKGESGQDGTGGGGGGDDDEEKAKRDSREERHRQLLNRLGEMEGTLWTKLAEFHVHSGELELARSVYEEALERVSRVRDFSLVFDAYMKFEEGVVEAMMELMEEDEDEDEEEEGEGEGAEDEKAQGESSSKDGDDEDMDILLGDAADVGGDGDGDGDGRRTSADVELALARAENLTSRRPLLLNRVLLRQNPHNVGEWTKRSELYLKRSSPAKAVAALEEGINEVDARRAVNGNPAQLWIGLASVHEERTGDADEARGVYRRVCEGGEYRFRDSDDLAQCWSSWAELELRGERWDEALSVARRATSAPEPEKSNKVTRGLLKSLRVWNLRLDLEESLGTVQTAKDAYNRCIELKVATPTHIVNFASFLEGQKYFEESFNAYEKGVDLFPFPHPGASVLWKAYLEAFLKRYEGTKVHRTRELFDRCLDGCPPEKSSEFFLLYGDFEEKYGLTKRALGVYERMSTAVPLEEKYTAYSLYIAKAVRHLGVPASRPLYERAIAALEDAPAARMCVEYSEVETKLGEIDRARTVLTYGAQMADPRRDPEYWRSWHDFEVSHGNEETFREMLRVKRGVQAAFSTVNYNAAEMGAGVPKVEMLTDERALEEIAAREGVKVNEAPRIGGFVQGKRTAEIRDLEEVERRAAKLRKATAGAVAGSGDELGADGEDGDEIDIDDEEDGNGGEIAVGDTNVKNVSTKSIPAAVFGGLAPTGEESEGGAKMGALERLRAAAAAKADAKQ